MPGTLSEVPRDIQRIVRAAARALGEDPEAIFDELDEHFGGREVESDLGASLIGLDAIAAYLGMSRRTVDNYVSRDRAFRDRLQKNKSNVWFSFESLLAPWKSVQRKKDNADQT